jgi:hypothetical protein
MSIARALVELKTLDARITKTFHETDALHQEYKYILCKTKNRNSNVQESEFKKAATANYQSVCDLILRRNAIKNAILKSNANTVVEIANKKMTVSEAIEFKNTIQYKTRLLDQLKSQWMQSLTDLENHRTKVQQKIDTNVQIICGKEKQDAAAIQSISDAITKGDPIDVYDPLGIRDLIVEMTTEIEDFTANVDFVLSESNAITTITV